MQVMFRGYFKANLWKMLAKLNYFYKQICAKQVSKAMMQRLEKKIALLVCKMEKVFPPRWINVMQHLLVYLPWEARVGGPVKFGWMYSQEIELKKKIDLQFATRQELRGVLWRHSCVKRLQTSQACISHTPTM
jgi:hypothetical protein